MARPRTAKLVESTYFKWRFGKRTGVWYADGRSNSPPLKRVSLGERDEKDARKRLSELDLKCAIEQGRADPALAKQFESGSSLPIAVGRQLYEGHQSRPRVAGGIRKKSLQRYKAVFDKFERFTERRGIANWEAVTGRLIEEYLAELESKPKPYCPRTLYLEGTTLKQTIGWLRKRGHLQTTFEIDLTLKKPRGSNRHCWTTEEFQLMLKHCRERKDLHWMADVILALGLTGVRISELANLRWSDVDVKKGVILLVDESSGAATDDGREGRTTKSGKDRSFPINPVLLPVLEAMSRHRDGFVFHGPLGGRLKPDRVRIILQREVLRPIAETAPSVISPRFKSGSPHSFRHFFCSECSNSGVPQRTVMGWLGHSDSKMIEYYYHLSDEESKVQMAKLRVGIAVDN